MHLIGHGADNATRRVAHRSARVSFHGKTSLSRSLARHVFVEGMLVSVGRKEVGSGNAGVAGGTLRRTLGMVIAGRAISLKDFVVSMWDAKLDIPF